MSKVRIYYFLSNHISHIKAAQSNVRCLFEAGAEIVSRPEDADVIVIHEEPPVYPQILQKLPDLRDKYVVAYSVWETDRLPNLYAENLQIADEIWTASDFSAGIFRQNFDNVRVVPHLVEAPETDEHEKQKLAEYIHHDPAFFYFYTICKPIDPRKNLWTLIAAFQRLLPEIGDKARLLIKQYDARINGIGQLPGIVALSGNMLEKEIIALHSLMDCYVSPHTSEAWGLGISEAMSHGNLAIATGHSGNMQYMNPDNSICLPATQRKLNRSEILVQPLLLDERMSWYEIDSDALLSAMADACNGVISPEIAAHGRKITEKFGVSTLTANFTDWLNSFEGRRGKRV